MAPDQIKRVQRDWTRVANEPIEVEAIGGAIYAFGSELACLRLFYHYRYCDMNKIRTQFSKNLQKWYFSLDSRLAD